MPADLTVVIADVIRMPAIRSGLPLSGRAVWFNNSNLAAACEAIRSHEPRLVAVDAVFGQTQQGLALIKRIESLLIPACAIRLIIHSSAGWTTSPREVQTANAELPIVQVPASPIRPAVVAAARVPSTVASTRRAPRFPLTDALNAAVEGGHASLVNISVLGAQVVSQPVLRPGQTVKIALPDANDLLRLTAHVAWSVFQQYDGSAVYRAGIAFTDAAQETLDDYCRRYGAENPLPTY